MTTPSPEPVQVEPPDATTHSVADYLRKHREFFVEHPELLSDLIIPHPTGKAVSLVERQMEILRGENRDLKAKFRELVTIARENEELARRLHRLTLKLVAAANLDEIFAGLYEGLRQDFAAEKVVLCVFGRSTQGERAEFSGGQSPLRPLFAEVLESQRPQCGRLKRNQLKALFGDDEREIGSAAVLPLGAKHWQGVLVIASPDPHRYHSEMGIDLLAPLADVVSLIIHPWVAG